MRQHHTSGETGGARRIRQDREIAGGSIATRGGSASMASDPSDLKPRASSIAFTSIAVPDALTASSARATTPRW